ncbi:TlyA family RNA methyltransferase [Patulibacter brassicae]|jgi:23S rRNA (cytidine1920-2'-O)/16S rRNA (cytidine1409-2'-O)-methyltransferase|uniref:TlyA family RNA methyltransferase n=1 Tax=Patulibacter brassicae TaxID=1705717 RepID=A0ABU4VGL8_9ACTN|nr:TlyA family RNA methyltransferase [Patulibacter brassicae]MDX8149975.1 TlyA family RNA methyltransferase [Patulibacter brassicae]
MAKVRLDTLLHRRGLYPSRSAAAAAILAGDVRLGAGAGPGALKPGTQVDEEAAVDAAAPPPFVSRGGIKLANALDALGIDVAGRRALDVGASTGGFTDCLLQRGAAHVIALDVAYGELAWSVRQDERVTVIERQNARHVTPEMLPFAPDLVVADVSFISLRKLLPALASVVAPRFDALLMVKPQFEVGRERVGSGGVVRDPALRREAIVAVGEAARAAGWSVRGAAPSGLPGPKGNRETFLHLGDAGDGDLVALARAAEPDRTEAPA